MGPKSVSYNISERRVKFTHIFEQFLRQWIYAEVVTLVVFLTPIDTKQ